MKKSEQIYVALFRGINVGGNNKVEMKKLKTTFETLGFKDIATYINSGNVVFKSKPKAASALSSTIEDAVRRDFDLDLKILVKDLPSIEAINKVLPTHWVKDKTMRTDVMFLWEEFDTPESLELMQLKEVDNILYAPGALLCNIMDKDYDQSGMIKMIGSKLYKNMTIRNVNTFRKLLEMMREME
ncbi:MAG TPA: DUF1697 domain-containing protein [Saprospiraceae bacterium]|nr:DUF1697 domain-containing protein [Saprospiraceae bacterium]HRO07362.1 DUF1697 domain-containing protein [Saprospiraceae bacterium]HRP40645.1 DUF1697 domain-containing protein [Saprospiraceae bacterium]